VGEEFIGTLSGKTTTGAQTRVVLDADTGNIQAGGNGRGGDVVLADDAGKVAIWIDGGGAEGSSGGPIPLDPELVQKSGAVVSIGGDGVIRVGGSNHSADLLLRNGAGEETIRLRAVYGSEGESAGIWIGGGGEDPRQNQTGWLTLRNRKRTDIAVIGGENGWISLRAPDGKQTVSIGGEAHNAGQLLLSAPTGAVTIAANAVDGNESAAVWIGGGGDKVDERATGWLHILNKNRNEVVVAGGENGWISVRNEGGTEIASIGGETGMGLLDLRDDKGTTMIELGVRTQPGSQGATGRFGGNGVDGNLLLFSQQAKDQTHQSASIWIQGGSGDIVLKNADCAEEFELAPGPEVESGTVMVIRQDGLLEPSESPYDRAVAGVASGGGDARPGIVLGHRPDHQRRFPIALAGRVFCQVDANLAPIEVGDLLTTSATTGCAMKATDPRRAFGAVLGKALQSVGSGRSRIPILVALQ
jgi:hypothetical protein